MESTTHLTIVDPQERQLSAIDMKSRVDLIQQVMQSVMKEGTHYGIIPGTATHTLLKPGAEVLGVTFRLAPRYLTKREDLGNGHREYEVTTTLYHIPSGHIVGEGVGSCSTLESKYRYRYASRLCPACHKDTIARSKSEYGGGYYCNTRKGGCGAKFADDAPEIVGQEAGRVENPDIADQYNTVLKMAVKRSHVAATLTATAASDIFSQQDVDGDDEEEPPPRQREPARPAPPPAPPPAHQQAKGGPHTSPETPYITQGQIGFLMQTCTRSQVPEQVLVDYLGGRGIESRKVIPQKDFNDIIAWVKANQKSGAAA